MSSPWVRTPASTRARPSRPNLERRASRSLGQLTRAAFSLRSASIGRSAARRPARLRSEVEATGPLAIASSVAVDAWPSPARLQEPRDRAGSRPRRWPLQEVAAQTSQKAEGRQEQPSSGTVGRPSFSLRTPTHRHFGSRRACPRTSVRRASSQGFAAGRTRRGRHLLLLRVK